MDPFDQFQIVLVPDPAEPEADQGCYFADEIELRDGWVIFVGCLMMDSEPQTYVFPSSQVEFITVKGDRRARIG